VFAVADVAPASPDEPDVVTVPAGALYERVSPSIVMLVCATGVTPTTAFALWSPDVVILKLARPATIAPEGDT
jgi:hypothetical protein